jgi:hypothetical protein
VRLKPLEREPLTFLALVAAWLGIWGAWVPNASASLSQNLFYLAEWSTFLPVVRSGQLRLAPDVLRLSACLGTFALLFAARPIQPAWVRWVTRAVTAVPILFVLLPPYPDVLQLWGSPSYGARFGVASVLGLGMVISVQSERLSAAIRRWLIVGTGLLGAAAALTGLLWLIPPFAADYGSPLNAGWGELTFFAGLALAILAQSLPERIFYSPSSK